MLSDEMLEGLVIHVLEPTQMLRTTSEFAPAMLLRRGDVVELTAEDIAASKNRNGESSFACIDDPDLQRLRWGKEIFGIGGWPADLPVYRDESEDPASWNSTRVLHRSTTIAAYAGSDGRTAQAVRPALRPEW